MSSVHHLSCFPRSAAIILASAWLMSDLSMAGMLPGPTSDVSPIQIRTVNQVAKCLTLEHEQVKTIGPITVLEVRARAKTSVAACGCMSQLLAYRTNESVSIDGKREEYERAFGLVAAPRNVKQSKVFSFVLKTDSEVLLTGRLSVSLSCKAPD